MSRFFDDLMESVQRMDEIHRGERQPSRSFSADTPQTPAAITVCAMDELESGIGKRFDSANALFKDLEI